MNDILDKLDSFLEKSKESEQKLFFLLPILIFGFLSYYFLYPINNTKLTEAINKNQNLNQKIEQITNKNNRLNTNNLRIKKILKLADRKLAQLNKQKIEIETLTKKLVIFRFDLQKWADFYNNIPSLAKKYKLFIISLDNIMLNPKEDNLVQKKMEIKIDVYGDFVNFVKFINAFESQKELVEVKFIDIKENKMSVVFDIYGAKL